MSEKLFVPDCDGYIGLGVYTCCAYGREEVEVLRFLSLQIQTTNIRIKTTTKYRLYARRNISCTPNLSREGED